MAQFTVMQVIDGDTFDVDPGWEWNGSSGSRVRPTGYDAPELNEYGGKAAKKKLTDLILGEKVTLGAAHRVDRGRLVCDVSFGGRRLGRRLPGVPMSGSGIAERQSDRCEMAWRLLPRRCA